MNLELENSVAVVVGGAKGIGLVIAEAFAAERARVALVDVDPAVQQVAERLAAQRTLAVVADVTDYAAVQDATATITNDLGPANHVVYAAGVPSGKFGFPFWNLEPADWPRVLEVNLLGAVHVAHAFCPSLVAARAGTMLFISSVAGQIGSQTDPPYSASKAALINFSQCMAKDLATYDVRANTICPGMVKTAINQSIWQAWHDGQPEQERLSYDDWASQKIQHFTPLNRWQEPSDIAAMAVFLASPQAKNITGQTINVDGGWVM